MPRPAHPTAFCNPKPCWTQSREVELGCSLRHWFAGWRTTRRGKDIKIVRDLSLRESASAKCHSVFLPAARCKFGRRRENISLIRRVCSSRTRTRQHWGCLPDSAGRPEGFVQLGLIAPERRWKSRPGAIDKAISNNSQAIDTPTAGLPDVAARPDENSMPLPTRATVKVQFGAGAEARRSTSAAPLLLLLYLGTCPHTPATRAAKG